MGKKIVIAEKDNIGAVIENGKVTEFFVHTCLPGRQSILVAFHQFVRRERKPVFPGLGDFRIGKST